MNVIELTIPMECPTQGSINTYPIKSKTGKIKYNQVHAHSKEIIAFRKLTRAACEYNIKDFYIDDINVGYIIEIMCYVSKPKSVKRDLPTVRGTGDIDKLARTVLDALTLNEIYNPHGIYRDDSQVVKLYIKKLYVDEENTIPVTKIKATKVILKGLVNVPNCEDVGETQ